MAKNGGRGRGKGKRDRSTGVDGKPADDAPQQLSNVEARGDYIRAQKGQIAVLNTELQKLAEEMSGKRKLINDAYRAMKSKLGMKREDIVFAFRLLDLEEEPRDEALDTIREIFNASGVGFQGDLVDVLERIEQRAGAQKQKDASWGEDDDGADLRGNAQKQREADRAETEPVH